MELKAIDKCARDKREIRSIFLEAFPSEERPPYFILVRRAKKPNVDFYGAYDGEKLVGLTYVVWQGDLAYLFFLAIKREERGHGYGGQVLALIKQKYKQKRLFLALEQLDEAAENYQQRLSRHRFYKRCGFRDLPCKIKEGALLYDVMGIGGTVKSEEYKCLIDSYLGRLMKHLVDMRLLEE